MSRATPLGYEAHPWSGFVSREIAARVALREPRESARPVLYWKCKENGGVKPSVLTSRVVSGPTAPNGIG
jgi:hypothetical protein